QVYGTLAALSTDGGATFFDRYFAEPAPYSNPVGDRTDYGYPSAAQLPNGKIVSLTYRGVVSGSQTNIAVSVFTEDWACNTGNLYNNCESSAGWTFGAGGSIVSVSSTHAHNGTNAIKIDNSAGAGSYAQVIPWTSIVKMPGKVAVSGWIY